MVLVSQTVLCERRGQRRASQDERILPRPFALQRKHHVFGWEAGIRTPIPWSRERCTGATLWSVQFQAVSLATSSVRFTLLCCAPVQFVSSCLTLVPYQI